MKIIIDTDMAVDDWGAILYLCKHPDADVIGITVTGSGETHLRPGLTNVAKLLHLSNYKEILVAGGDDLPIDGFHEFPTEWREDVDIMSGVYLPISPKQPSKIHAVDAIEVLLGGSDEPVTIVALGPLINIAQLIDRNSPLLNRIERIFIMVGAVKVKGNLIQPLFTPHITNELAEWNIYIDPIAAYRVFHSGLPITLVPLDVTNKVQIDRAFVDEFKRRVVAPEAEFIAQTFDRNRDFVDSGEYYFWDPLTASVAVDSDLFKLESMKLDVYIEYSDEKVPFGRRHFEKIRTGQTFLSDSGVNIDVCVDVAVEKFRERFMKILNEK
jgi:inosine-uridine nucleoside N-ribohydrolase